MKIIKQLSEDEFVVKMGEEDLNKDRRIVVAHDYVKISGHNWYCNNFQVKGKYGFGNVLDIATSIQIPIRMAQDMFKTICDHKYMQPDHLLHDGNPAYLYPDAGVQSYNYTKDTGERMIAIMDPETGKFIHMPQSIFNQIKNSIENKNNSVE